MSIQVGVTYDTIYGERVKVVGRHPIPTLVVVEMVGPRPCISSTRLSNLRVIENGRQVAARWPS